MRPCLVVAEDVAGALWLGTDRGLNLFHPESKTFTVYTQQDGLPDDSILGIIGDEAEDLWLSTNKGLTRFSIRSRAAKVFNISDGLQGSQFYPGSFFEAQSGQFFFGGMDGFNAFYPAAVKAFGYAPPIRLTSLKANQRELLTSPPIAQNASLELDHDQNALSFEFSALDYTAPKKNKYSYKLKGFEGDWSSPGFKRFVSYTNLGPGDYRFQVRGTNNDGVWSDKQIEIPIKILPPPWLTWWAYTLYALSILLVIFAYHRQQKRKVEAEYKINERLLKLDTLKDEFLTATSRELLSPLESMIGITESLKDGAAGPINRKLYEDLLLVISTGKLLVTLVDDILDFSHLNNNELVLHQKTLDFHALTDVVLTIIRPLLGLKDLKLKNQVSVDLPSVKADESRLQQIMHDLIGYMIQYSNAGTITVSAEVRGERLLVQVSDSRADIPHHEQERILKFFAQADDAGMDMPRAKDLGLVVAKKLVLLHGSNIELHVYAQGATFSFSLEITQERAESMAQNSVDVHAKMSAQRIENLNGFFENQHEPKAPAYDFHILIIEDEAPVRRLLVNYLALDFQVSWPASFFGL